MKILLLITLWVLVIAMILAFIKLVISKTVWGTRYVPHIASKNKNSSW